MIVCLAQAQLQRAQLVLHTYECHLNATDIRIPIK